MLCGRVAETKRIDELVNAVRNGASGVLVIRGEAGIGKTSLLEYARVSAAGLQHIPVRGSEPETNLVFAGLAQVVYPWRDRVGKLPEPQAQALLGAVALGPSVRTDRFAVYAATLGLLSLVAEDGPLLVTVDDAHLLDTPSAEALAFVARRLLAEGILILGASRSPRPDHDLGATLPTIHLEGLDATAAQELVALERGVRPGDGLARRLVERTAGNPMAIIEAAATMSVEQLRGGPATTVPPPERTAGALFSRRVGALPDTAQLALLLLASTKPSRLGRAFEAGALLDVPRQAFTDLELAGLVALHAERFDFAHPLVMTAAVSAAAPPQRRAAHRALAAVLTHSADVEERAWHLAEATLGTDEHVAATLEDLAGTARERSGYAAAVRALEHAAALTPDDSTRARRLYLAAADAQVAGDSSRARELFMAAAPLAENPELRLAIATGRSRVEAFTGRPRLAYRILQDALPRVPAEDRERRTGLLTDCAMAALLAGDPAAALASAEEATRLARDPASGWALVARVVHGITLFHLGRHPEGARRLVGTPALGALTGPGAPPQEYVALAGAALVWVGDHEGAATLIEPLLRRLRADGALGLLPFALYVSASLETRSGRTGQGRALAAEALDLAELTGDAFWRYLALSALAHVEAIRRDEPECRAHAERALGLVGDFADFPRDASEALGLLELGLGNYRKAVRCFLRGTRAQDDEIAQHLVEGHLDFIEAYYRCNHVLTPRMTAILGQYTADEYFPLHAAVAWRLRAFVGPDCDVDAGFGQALELHERVLCPFERARTQLAYGERLRRCGRRVHAREQLHPALDAFERMDARAWAETARRELGATGQSVRETPARSPLERLTPQEYQVARAVIRGDRNRDVAASLFLSTKTVEFHLGNVFRKLGVRSRTELAHLYRELAEA